MLGKEPCFMELKEAILTRRSIRGYLPDPVPQEVLRDVLKLATRAVSGQNVQPWEFVVLTGDALKAVAAENIVDLENDRDPDYPDPPLAEEGLDRARFIGRQLFTSMNIERGDKERRNWWLQRGFRFFDAPAVILLTIDKKWASDYRFDIGCVAQSICLAAMEYGLGTCVESQAVTYQRGVRELMGIPDSKEFVYGIAIGYPDPEFPANAVITPREEVDNVTHWYGF